MGAWIGAAEQVKRISGKSERVRFEQEELAKLNPLLPSKFQLCISPRIECRAIVVDKCKVMSSKKLPLWLVFENADPRGEQYYAIFKVTRLTAALQQPAASASPSSSSLFVVSNSLETTFARIK